MDVLFGIFLVYVYIFNKPYIYGAMISWIVTYEVAMLRKHLHGDMDTYTLYMLLYW